MRLRRGGCVATARSIGIVGLGRIGMAIARRLAVSGVALVGFRRSNAEDFTALGGTLLPSPQEVLDAAEIVFTAVNDAAALSAIVLGENGFTSASASGRFVVDVSTTALAPRYVLRNALRERGSSLVDCPISGLPAMVDKRKGVMLASGEPEEFAAVQATLRMISDEVHFVGPFGNGTKLKYIANYLMTVNAAAAAEAVAAIRLAGLNPLQAVDVLSRGAGGSHQLNSRGPNMALHRFDAPPASLDQLADDLDAIADFQISLGIDSRLLSAARDLVDDTRRRGLGGCDPTALVVAVEGRAGAVDKHR